MTRLSLYLGLFELVKKFKIISFLFCVFIAEFFYSVFFFFNCILWSFFPPCHFLVGYFSCLLVLTNSWRFPISNNSWPLFFIPFLCKGQLYLFFSLTIHFILSILNSFTHSPVQCWLASVTVGILNYLIKWF